MHEMMTTTTPVLRRHSCQVVGRLTILRGDLLSFFLIPGGTRSLCMPALRPASQAGPVRNPRKGTNVVLYDTDGVCSV